jgi:hypothetical protein
MWHWIILAAFIYWLWRRAVRANGVKKDDPYVPPLGHEEVDARPVRLTAQALFPLDVVGLNYRPDAVHAAIAGRLRKLRADFDEDDLAEMGPDDLETLEVTAVLEYENSNPHDVCAVKVLIGKHHVGYVPQRMTSALRGYLRDKGMHGALFSCKAELEVAIKSGEVVSMQLMLPRLKNQGA